MALAELKGTEKQVNWAKAIRKDRLMVWQRADAERFQDVELMLNRQAAASWWITCKGKSLKEVCSILEGVAKTKASCMKATSHAPLKAGTKKGVEEVWETVATASGFMRSGPTRDTVTGDVVLDSNLPF